MAINKTFLLITRNNLNLINKIIKIPIKYVLIKVLSVSYLRTFSNNSLISTCITI